MSWVVVGQLGPHWFNEDLLSLEKFSEQLYWDVIYIK
jgi:hypothetical protein